MLTYFAAPLFCEAERAYNAQLTAKLEERGFTVFLPQRDGVEVDRPPYNQMSSDERCRAIFALDRDKVLEADILLFVLDGRVPDEGACVELGIAYGQNYLLQRKKLLIGLLTDMRGALIGAKLNAMVYSCFEHIAENEDDLIDALEEYRRVRTER
jgi:nucleoside 2-deoxyribosyltransferase